jgi:hypothetical protein
MTTKDLVLSYWRSWQKPDFAEMRSYLADTMMLGGHPAPSESFVKMCESGSKWRDVKLVDSVFGPDGGAIAYEGVDTKTNAHMKVMEIVHVVDGKIVGLHGMLVADGKELQPT